MIVTEKPSVAMSYAKVLGVQGRQDGYLEGSGYIVSWCICPGYMDTEMCANMTQERKDECTKRIPAGRWGLPEDMKGPVVFLASAASDYLNGALIPVDGGYLVK